MRVREGVLGPEICNQIAIVRELNCPNMDCDIIIHEKECSSSSGVLIRMLGD